MAPPRRELGSNARAPVASGMAVGVNLTHLFYDELLLDSAPPLGAVPRHVVATADCRNTKGFAEFGNGIAWFLFPHRVDYHIPSCGSSLGCWPFLLRSLAVA